MRWAAVPVTVAAALLGAASAAPLAGPGGPAPEARLPRRVQRIVLHVLGNPSYDRPDRRWRFFTPPETQSHWKPRFGAHWIVWTDGTLWPRHPRPGQPPAL